MGGMGSGAKRSVNAGNLEDTLSIDIRALRRLGLARLGECMIDTVQWSFDGLSVASARLRVDLSEFERGGTLKITGNMPDRSIKQMIAIEAVPSGFGGHRCYFICPIELTRSEVLYYAHGRFASRKAQRLTYAVQGMTDLSRARRKAAKLECRLKGKNGFARTRGRNRFAKALSQKEAKFEARQINLKKLRDLRGDSYARIAP